MLQRRAHLGDLPFPEGTDEGIEKAGKLLFICSKLFLNFLFLGLLRLQRGDYIFARPVDGDQSAESDVLQLFVPPE